MLEFNPIVIVAKFQDEFKRNKFKFLVTHNKHNVLKKITLAKAIYTFMQLVTSTTQKCYFTFM